MLSGEVSAPFHGFDEQEPADPEIDTVLDVYTLGLIGQTEFSTYDTQRVAEMWGQP